MKTVADSMSAKSHAYNLLQAAFNEAKAKWAAGPEDPREPCPYCGLNSRHYKMMSKMLTDIKNAGANSKEALALKADLTKKQEECAALENRATELADQVKQLGLTLEAARASRKTCIRGSS